MKSQFLCGVLRYTRDLEPKSLYDCLYRTNLYYIERCEKMLSVLVSVLYDDFRCLRYSFAVTLNKSCLTHSHAFYLNHQRNTLARISSPSASPRHFYNGKECNDKLWSIFIASFSIKFWKLALTGAIFVPSLSFFSGS